jgi:carboxymethylenebutenolidase
MIENDVMVTTKYGRQHAFAVCPDAPGKFPPVILYMDAPGYREELRNMARRIANQGYFCLLPDLYYRLGTIRFDIPRRDDAMSAVIRGAMNSLSVASVMEDTAGMIGFLDAHDKVKPGAIGCVGHCMSGPFAVAAAAYYGRMKGAASLYGVNMVTDAPDSPHLLVGRVKGELYLNFAETDPGVPATVVPTLEAAMKKAGTKNPIEPFAATHHGFCFAPRADSHAAAAEACFERLLDLWDRNLR